MLALNRGQKFARPARFSLGLAALAGRDPLCKVGEMRSSPPSPTFHHFLLFSSYQRPLFLRLVCLGVCERERERGEAQDSVASSQLTSHGKCARYMDLFKLWHTILHVKRKHQKKTHQHFRLLAFARIGCAGWQRWRKRREDQSVTIRDTRDPTNGDDSYGRSRICVDKTKKWCFFLLPKFFFLQWSSWGKRTQQHSHRHIFLRNPNQPNHKRSHAKMKAQLQHVIHDACTFLQVPRRSASSVGAY